METNTIEKKRKNRPAKLGQYKCSYCKELGHNKVKCPKRLQDESINKKVILEE
jgi:wyosine [tRNA(Phe)-imidazoG37] synthetase (radical SAM superfamily)